MSGRGTSNLSNELNSVGVSLSADDLVVICRASDAVANQDFNARGECVSKSAISCHNNIGSEVPFRIGHLSDYKRRKYLGKRDRALIPNISLNRFKESFNNSNASDSLKQRLLNLKNKSGDG